MPERHGKNLKRSRKSIQGEAIERAGDRNYSKVWSRARENRKQLIKPYRRLWNKLLWRSALLMRIGFKGASVSFLVSSLLSQLLGNVLASFLKNGKYKLIKANILKKKVSALKNIQKNTKMAWN